jgi:membrane protease YdiL (CAAX protease family)
VLTELLQPATTARKTWRVRDAALVGFVLVSALFFVVWFGPDSRNILSSFHITSQERSQLSLLVIVLSELCAMAVAIAGIARLRTVEDFLASVGWNANRRSAQNGIFVGLVLSGIITLALALLSTPPSRFTFSPLSIGLYGLTTIVIQPFVEECYFRGVLFAALANRLGKSSGVALSAVLFGLFHMGGYRLLWVFLIVGLVMGLIRLRTHSVATCVFSHAAYNAGILIFALAHIG